MKKLSIIFSIAIITAGCGKAALEPQDYIGWIRNSDNGLVINRSFDEITIDASYIPNEATALRSLSGIGAITKINLDSAISSYEGTIQFQLKFSGNTGMPFMKTGISSSEEYYSRLNYMTSHIGEDLKLVIEQDTIDCQIAHLERTYGVGPSNTLTLAFEGDISPEADLELIYDDRALGLGRTKFRFKSSSLQNVPRITV